MYENMKKKQSNIVDIERGRSLSFRVTGHMIVPKDAELIYRKDGVNTVIVGIELPDKTIKLQLGLEVNEGEKVLTNNDDMGELGIKVIDYFATYLTEND